MTPGPRSAPVLELRGARKSYPGVVALDGVDLDVHPNEILGLVGENGAGKSTLMKILVGLVQPDAGSLRVRGAPVTLANPADAIRNGIGMVFQDGSMVPNLSVMENLFLCHEDGFRRLGLLSRRAMRERAASLLQELDLRVDVEAAIADVSPAVRQMVELSRLLWLSTLYGRTNPVLILDEPTTVLNESERGTLFQIMGAVKHRASIVFISHRLQEVVEVSDRIVILKDGRNVTELRAANARVADIEQLMVGHTFSADRYREEEQAPPGPEEVLEVKELRKRGAFDAISFAVRRGEIVALVGLVGSGKEAICKCIAGLQRPDAGQVQIAGKELTPGSPAHAVASGQGYVPIDRRSEGLALNLSVAKNVNLLVLERLGRGGLVHPGRERANASRWMQECRIKAPTPGTTCGALSGGNQQKAVMAKWLSSDVKLLVLDHPTRGVDVGAKDDIYRLLRKLARDGIGMIVMCDTLEEDIGLSHRLLVLKDGRLVGEVPCPPGRKPGPRDVIGMVV
jgi:ribose transport system ATP-binding protein